MAIAVPRAQQQAQTQDELVQTWKDRINHAREHRRPIEPTMLSNLAFAAGQHWQVWDDGTKKMRHISEMDPQYAERQLYTADKINEYVQAQLGELSTGDDRPELLTAQEGDAAEQIEHEINDCAAHGWDFEWQADSALTQVRRLCLRLGVSAIRVRFDPSRGPVIKRVPMHPTSGQPVLDDEPLSHLEQYGQLPDGSLPTFKQIHEGLTVWEPLSALNLLTPPGVNHENAFPWEIVVRPVLLDHLIEEYGQAAESVREDTDIASVMGLSTAQVARTGQSDQTSRGRLRGHAWLFTCYERPCRSYPQGQVVHLASNSFKLLRIDEEMPYQTVSGDYRSGIHYFHWWRLDDRFHSRSFIEPMKDGQRLVNEVATGSIEIMRRGYPKAFVKEGAIVENPKGLPLEVVELTDTSLEPHFFAGIGPGDWMFKLRDVAADDLAHASTLSALRLGENPPGANTYGQLAILNENESSKRSSILQEHAAAIAAAVEDSMQDVRRYWPESKRILISGDDGKITQKTFAKARIPDFFIVRPAKGSAKPRSQGAELLKIDAIKDAAVQAGLFNGPNAAKWVDWYAKSLDAGIVQDLPGTESDSQVDFAHFENFLMLEQGETPVVADHDLAPIHVPVHREALDQARATGDVELLQRILGHIKAHIDAVPKTRKAWRTIDPADINDLASDVALDEDQALRENDLLLQGVPLNPEEYQKALASLQHGIDPESGQQLDMQSVTPQQLQDILQNAALKPTLVENLQVHLDRHGKVIKSAAFETFPEPVRQRFITHFNLTRELWLSIPMLPDKMTPPHVTLQLREDVGPSTTAQILRRAGVPEADPSTIKSEPPLTSTLQVIDQIKDLVPPPDENELTSDDEPGASDTDEPQQGA